MARTNAYLSRFLSAILAAQKAGKKLTDDELGKLFRTSRAGAGGETRAAKVKDAQVSASDIELELADQIPMEEVKSLLNTSLMQRFPNTGTHYVDAYIKATFPTSMDLMQGKVIYSLYKGDAPTQFFHAEYDITKDGVNWTNDKEVVEQRSFVDMQGNKLSDDSIISLMYGVPGKAQGKAVPANVSKLPANKQRQWAEVWNSAYTNCTKKGGDAKTCETSAFKQANGVALGDEVNDTIQLSDYGDVSWPGKAITLSDDGTLPEWTHLHFIGEHAVPHGSGISISFDAAMGDQMIANFYGNVLERKVPLDMRHDTDSDGVALATLQDLGWGSEDTAKGHRTYQAGDTHLWSRWRYNALGQVVLGDDELMYISPQYWLNYVRKRDKKEFGVALSAAAATNNPFLKMRSIKGEPVPVSDDSLAAHDADTGALIRLEDGMSTPNPGQSVSLTDFEALKAQLAEKDKREADRDKELAELRRGRHEDQVKAYLADLEHKGLPPAIAKLAKPVLLNCNPAHEAVIALDDAKPDAKVNLDGAVRAMLAEVSAMGAKLLNGSVTRPVDVRLPDRTAPAALDEQVLAQGADFIHSLAGSGFTRNGTNGAHNTPAEI